MNTFLMCIWYLGIHIIYFFYTNILRQADFKLHLKNKRELSSQCLKKIFGGDDDDSSLWPEDTL